MVRPLAPSLALISVTLLSSFAVPGCESFSESQLITTERFSRSAERRKEAEKYRTRYQTERDPDAMRWLLRHEVAAGMTLEEVNEAIGEEGAREYNDRHIKTSAGRFRQTDEVYRWGPDANGRSIYLVFRDDQLVWFDRNDPDL